MTTKHWSLWILFACAAMALAMSEPIKMTNVIFAGLAGGCMYRAYELAEVSKLLSEKENMWGGLLMIVVTTLIAWPNGCVYVAY
jgi:hypothetical protein